MSKYKNIADCFDDNGNFIIKGFDPYRVGDDVEKRELYEYLFDERGYANIEPRYEVYDLIEKHKWHFTCDAIKYYYAAECIDSNCKSNYTAIYAWRH